MSYTYFPGLGFKADQPIRNDLLTNGFAMGGPAGVHRISWLPSTKQFSFVDDADVQAGILASNIGFPITQQPSTDPNTLDDYEEGTWTGSFAAGAGTITIGSRNTGTYTKIGRQVTLAGWFQVSTVSSPSGSFKLNGIPFAPSSAGDQFSVAVAVQLDTLNATVNRPLMGVISAGDTGIQLFEFFNGTLLAMAGDVIAGTNVRVGCSYFI